MSEGSRRTQPLPPNWKALRAQALARDGGVCQWRVEGAPGGICGAPATEVDHVIGAAEGGSDDMSNLASLCKPHHGTKTGIEAGQRGGLAAGEIRREIASRKTRKPERHPGYKKLP
jgi:5-methylcytosine-specific restriction protein A